VSCSRFAVTAFADLAFDDIDESVETFVGGARRLSQAQNLLGVGLNFSFVYFGNREQGANAFFGAPPPFIGALLRFDQRINLCARLRLSLDDEFHRPLHFFVSHRSLALSIGHEWPISIVAPASISRQNVRFTGDRWQRYSRVVAIGFESRLVDTIMALEVMYKLMLPKPSLVFFLTLFAISSVGQTRSTDSDKQGEIRAHYEAAQAQEKKGDWVAAETEWKLVLQLAPDDARACTNLGIALSRQDKTAEAIEAWKRAAALDSRLAGAHFNLGLALVRRGDYSNAILPLRRALLLEPENQGARRGGGCGR